MNSKMYCMFRNALKILVVAAIIVSNILHAQESNPHTQESFSIIDRYYAARSLALAKETDSVFAQLFYFANHLYDTDNFYQFTVNYFLQIPEILPEDTVMNYLHGDRRWDEFMTTLKDNRDKARAGLDVELMAILDTIYKTDQAG